MGVIERTSAISTKITKLHARKGSKASFPPQNSEIVFVAMNTIVALTFVRPFILIAQLLCITINA